MEIPDKCLNPEVVPSRGTIKEEMRNEQHQNKRHMKQPTHEQRTLRKQAYSNILKILPPKNENFQINKSDIYHISAQFIDCGYSLEPPWWGGSIEYPQSMFLNRNKKNIVYPVNTILLYKWGLRGSELYRRVFMMELQKSGTVSRRTTRALNSDAKKSSRKDVLFKGR